jgi:hypothetical protein
MWRDGGGFGGALDSFVRARDPAAQSSQGDEDVQPARARLLKGQCRLARRQEGRL